MAWAWWNNFDKRFCGKWITKDFVVSGQQIPCFLKVEYDDAEGVRVDHSFISIQWLPSLYVEYSYDRLYFFHNDRKHRAEYTLSIENDDVLVCKHTATNCWGETGTLEFNLTFTRLTEAEEKKYTYTVEPKDMPKIDILREYMVYGDIQLGAEHTYAFNEREHMLDIIEPNNLDELVKGKTDVETAIALMNWLCERYKHGNPLDGLPKGRTPQALMMAAEKFDNRTNCRGLSIILAHLIRAYGIKAFHTTCMPYEEPFDDCHVVVSVYAESMNKWIMLDPTSNLYLKNDNGEIIGVDEFREILIAGGKLMPNDERFPNWSRADKPETFIIGYSEYMAKNLIRIVRGVSEGYGKDANAVILLPKKYMENEAKNFAEKEQKCFITSKEEFWKV